MPSTPDRSERQGTEWSPIEEEDREDGHITEGSCAHLVASVLYEDGPLRPIEVRERLSGVKKGTISGSLSALYRLRFVERRELDERPPQGGRRHTEYRLNDRGEEFIKSHGTITEDDWLNTTP